jgi:adenylate kinase family enzyme
MKRAKLQWRKDDKPESIKKRLEIFQEETMPVINYLKSIWKVIEIDANDTVENIFKNTKKKLWL